MAIKIMGMTFEDSATLNDVVSEFKRRHLNCEKLVFYYSEAKKQFKTNKELEFLNAQELLNKLL